MRPKLVILRGKCATGKTTAFHHLKHREELKSWLLIDFPKLKNMYQYMEREEAKIYGKKALLSIMGDAMKEMRNIMTEEFSRVGVMKHLAYYVRRYNYDIRVFQFEADYKTCVKREAERMQAIGKKPLGKEWVRHYYEMHEKRFDKQATVVNTLKLNKKQVVDYIIEEIYKD